MKSYYSVLSKLAAPSIVLAVLVSIALAAGPTTTSRSTTQPQALTTRPDGKKPYLAEIRIQVDGDKRAAAGLRGSDMDECIARFINEHNRFSLHELRDLTIHGTTKDSHAKLGEVADVDVIFTENK